MRKINYPLIVSDFDGTLVKKDGTISEENRRAIDEFIRILSSKGIRATLRRKLGPDINASCGQLRREESEKE